MSELKNRIVVLLGAVLVAAIGRDKFYQAAQDRSGIIGRVASAWCQGHAGRIGQNYAIWRANKDKDRITDIALAFYNDDSLHGFADTDYAVRSGGKPLLDQQRGLIIPLVAKAIKDVGARSILEIGTGNGDILAHLANEFPDIKCVGVDLSVSNAQVKYSDGPPNLTFVKGYALDLLRQGEISGDVVFGTSTFCVFAPREFAAYLDALSEAKRIVISDPVTTGNVHSRDPNPKSRHMDLYMWWHNYFGWLADRGWNIDQHETVDYRYSNKDTSVVLVSATRPQNASATSSI